jgi:hypothetical protein
VIFVYSHLEAKDIVAGRAPPLLVAGNAIVDHPAGVGASLCRVSEADRARVAQVEHMAYWVRLRILASTLQTLEAEQNLSSDGAQGRPLSAPSS